MISKLATVTKLSPNHSGKRTHDVDTITPHCFVGQVTAERGLEVFLPRDRQASANYVIGYDGKIGCGVDEDNRSWCSSSRDNDQRAITIEVASDNFAPYAFKDEAYKALVALCVDICQRYNKTILTWIADKNTALHYVPKANEMRLTVHRWFANKSCPGDWMMNRMSEFAAEVTRLLGTTPQPTPTPTHLYKVQVGAYKVKANADKALKTAKERGYADAFCVKVDDLYKIQIGAYSKPENAAKALKDAKAKGYKDAFIVEV